ncbi:MAG: hypothetical protein OXD34_07570 [bacterium]|nr:hypothetical protein [bacterium]
MRANENIRYEPEDACPLPAAAGVAIQGVMLILPTAVVIVAVIAGAAGQHDSYLEWMVFAALLVGGFTTALQAGRIGRLGTGHLVIALVSPSYIAVSLLALSRGGPALLATLLLVAALIQFALAGWLSSLRVLITPVVSGTVLMLIAATILPVAFDRLDEVPSGAPPAAGVVIAAVTLAVTAGLILRGAGAWRLWTSLIGIVTGCAVAALMGSYDFRPVLDAPWLGIPEIQLPGLDLTPGADFWALVPVFVIISVVVGIKNIGDALVIQQVSRRRPRTSDFRMVQGLLNGNGAGSLLSAITGIPPMSVGSATTAGLVGFTGVASRRVGYLMGAILAALAFLPKLVAFLLTIPRPVMGAYLLVLMGMLFVEGIRTVLRDGLDHRKSLVVALAFSIGVGMDGRGVFSDLLGETWGASLDSGMTLGALVALALTLFIEATGRRRARLEVSLDMTALPEIDRYLTTVASGMGWNAASTDLLRAAGEETLSSLLQPADPQPAADAPPRLVIAARPDHGAVEMDFITVYVEDNLEDRLNYLDERSHQPDEREVSFRLLRHYASSIRHRKYYGAEVVTVRVES